MGNCCGLCAKKDTADSFVKLTPDEVERRREIQAKAADERAKEFKHGGGGEKVKAKQKKLEEAQKKNKDIGGPDMLRAGLFE